ncbi:hypothetical protein MG293_000966 [Ovis ammon polii]|uniref:Uncharacterized protein n=1 Tax=Ovis ammon polii TaxID=230172 RepID=A0AAD4YIW8_OVIAM|nr:hypothetical protein MG293_000966 [Ovis ammon polii]
MLIIDRRDIGSGSLPQSWGPSSSNRIRSKCARPAPPTPRPKQLQPTPQGQRPLTSAAPRGAPLKWIQTPSLPASSPERLGCPSPSHAHRTTPFASKREIGATIEVFRPSPSQLGEPPARPWRSAWSLGSVAGAGCRSVSVRLLSGVDGDKVDAFEEPNKYFSI